MPGFSEALEKINSDHHSGSAEILKHIIELFKSHLKKGDLKSIKDKSILLEKLKQQQEIHKTFLIVKHFLGEILSFFYSEHHDWNKELSEFIRNYELKWIHVNDRISASVKASIQLTKKTILLHSNSSTIKDLFKIHKTDSSGIKIIQTESRPIMEGRIQAEYLAGLGYHVTLITDAAVARYAENINMSILGADAIYKDFFVNKCGSHLIALVCQEHKVPLFVLADSRKLWINQSPPFNETFSEDTKPASEIWKSPYPDIQIENYYFDSVPNKLVDLFITETGRYQGKEIQKL